MGFQLQKGTPRRSGQQPALVVGGSGSEPASRATKELPSVLHEGVAAIIRRHLASDPAIREAYLQIGKNPRSASMLV